MVTKKQRKEENIPEQKKPKTSKRTSFDEQDTIQDGLPNVEPRKERPALTINIQSWATPIVAVVMLVIGALAGFYARPSVLGQLPENASEANPAVVIPTQDRSEEQQQLMASLVPRVRHFIGDSNAPVTIIEFGDFQ